MREIIATLDSFGGSYVATLGIAVVCSYLGTFTVLRRIVFTGVALAQLAAAGVAAAFFVADHPSTPRRIVDFANKYGSTVGSLGLTLLGAFGLQARPLRHKLSADALVGLVYTASSALAVLFVWRSSRGLVELRNILAGEVLLSGVGELLFLWIGLIAVAAIHVRYRRQFLLVSFDSEFARALKLPERFYQMLLLGTLAVAVALSLKAAGLLLVFAFLVLPALAGLTLGRTLSEATVLAICAALGAALIGFVVAISENLPVAPTIACGLLLLLGAAWLGGITSFLAWLVRGIFGVLAIAALVTGLIVFPVPDLDAQATHAGHPHALPTDDRPKGPTREERMRDALRVLAGFGSPDDRLLAIDTLIELRDGRVTVPLIGALDDEDERVTARAAEGIRSLSNVWGSRRMIGAVADGDDPELRVLAARALALLGDIRGIDLLVQSLGREETPLLLKESVLEELKVLSAGDDMGYDPFGSTEENAAAFQAWQAWWWTDGKRLTWSTKDKAFRMPPQ